MEKGVFYGIGVGPGDPELITIKAVNVLSKSSWVAFPKGSLSDTGAAYAIAKEYLPKACYCLELDLPMTRDKEQLRDSRKRAMEEIVTLLSQGKSGAFITLGDPGIYSTFLYIYKLVSEQGFSCEIIPGVPSFCASAAAAGTWICAENESFYVVAATAGVEKLQKALELSNNVIIMKAGKYLKEIKECIQKSRESFQIFIIERCGMEGERIFTDLKQAESAALGYFTTIILKRIEK